jgi:hypothetical protein
MSDQRFDNMFEANQAFQPMQNYGRHIDHNRPAFRFEYRCRFQIEAVIFANFITADYKFRQTYQQKEILEKNIPALGKIIGNEEDEKQRQQYQKDLEAVKRAHSENERKLFAQESMLPPGPLKRDYDAIREDPLWYLRKELVQDCIARGGCCARGCGCCESRGTTQYKRGVGHCTAVCGCCASERGFEHTSKELEKIADELNSMLLSRNPSYVIKMAEAYFVKPPARKVEKKSAEEKKVKGGQVQKKKVHWWK